MASIIESSYDSSENELLDKSLSVWRGSTSNFESEEVFLPVDVDLHTAASLGQFDCVRNYLKGGKAIANHKNRGGWTPLMYAAYIGHDNIIHLLLDVGVDVEARNPKGQTSLMLAACCGNESVAYFLLSAGADLEARDGRGWTALFHATYAGHQNVVKFLLENGANMEVSEPRRGMTPFMQAALEGHEIIVQDFLQHGVDMDAKSNSGDTARSMAIYVGHTKVVTLIDNEAQRRAKRTKTNNLSKGDSHGRKIKGPSILDGPAAFARLRDQASTSGGDGNLVNGNGSPEMIRAREITSPLRKCGSQPDSWSSGRSHDADDEDENDVFNQSGKLTIKPSTSSGSCLVAALPSNDPIRDSSGGQQLVDDQSKEFPRSLEELLKDLGLSKYMAVFNEQDVDLQVFLSLTDNDLKEVGIKLFGPRRKMANAIARWHSEMSCARNRLEQAYADKLEAEMQELAIQLHKAVAQMEKTRGDLLQERELRSVAEACLMEAWQHVRCLATDTKQQCTAAGELCRRTRFCFREMLSRRQQYRNVDLLANSVSERLNLDNVGASDVSMVSDGQMLLLSDQMIEKTLNYVLRINTNTEKLLGKEVNFQDSFGRIT